ncbi:MAG: hypothetical protein ACFB10_13320 [Salibacteraceae bacterium]
MTPVLSGTIILEGNYQGKNVYVQNPFAGSGVGFCVYEVTVNGDVTTDEINSSAFEIDLSIRQLDIGQAVTIAIKHKDDCPPRVLNPEVLKPKSTFETIEIEVSSDGVLKWKTRNEKGSLPYVIEQRRWNKWIKVGEVDGIGTPEINSYSFKVTPHSGANEFRVKQIDYTGEPRYSNPNAEYLSDATEVTMSPIKVKDFINFSSETMYEVYDVHGNIVKKGFGIKIDATNLAKGIYYVSYDNKTTKIIKK